MKEYTSIPNKKKDQVTDLAPMRETITVRYRTHVIYNTWTVDLSMMMYAIAQEAIHSGARAYAQSETIPTDALKVHESF